MRRVVTVCAFVFLAISQAGAQVIERPVPFDSAGLVTVMTPAIAAQAGLRPPWWPVSGEFTEARMFTANDSIYVLAVTRRSGVVERYSLSALDREAIRATVSKVPRSVFERKNDARNAFIRNQTLLGLTVYGPTFAGAVANDGATATAAYLVIAGGTFFAASELSRRMFISRAQNDLSTNTGANGALAGWALLYLMNAEGRGQAAGAFAGGVLGTALGLRAARNMTEAEAVGAGFGADIGALIAFGTLESFRRDQTCTQLPDFTIQCTGGRDISDKFEVATILAAGLIGYPLGVLYPRNAGYNVTPGDIQTLWTTTGLGALAGAALLPESPKQWTAAAAVTAGGVLGIILGDRLLVRRYDHSRTEASRVSLGATAGALIGLGIGVLVDQDSPQLGFALATAGGIAGLIASESYTSPEKDAGRGGSRLSFNPVSILLAASRAPGNHALLNVRF